MLRCNLPHSLLIKTAFDRPAVRGIFMRHPIILACFIALATGATVLADTTGRDEAYAQCQRLTFNDNVQQCIQLVQHSQYFSTGALPVCGAMQADMFRLDCMRSIANKIYIDGEINVCASRTFDSQKNDCFRQTGQPYAPPAPGCNVDIVGVRQQLSAAQNMLRTGRYQYADRAIADLIFYFDSIRH
jgi:hypothetical protein